jgi:CBS domain containing-hemolysin-like protein
MGAIGRQPSFVDEQLSLTALLARWRHGGGTMSVVRDRGGHVTGVVTLSDVLDWLLEAVEGEAVVPGHGGGVG